MRDHRVVVDALTPFSDDSGVDTAPLWALVAEQLTAAGADLGALRPGATEADIAAAEAELGVPLPEDVRAIHRDHDGCSEALLDGREYLSLGRMVSEWRVWRDLLQRGCFEDAEPAPSGGGEAAVVQPALDSRDARRRGQPSLSGPRPRPRRRPWASDRPVAR